MKNNMKATIGSSFFAIALILGTLFPVSSLSGQTVDTPYDAYLEINYYMHLNQPEQAEELINRFLEKYPDDPFVLTEKAYLLQNVKNDTEAATALLEKAITIYPEYYYSNYLLASLFYTLYPEDKAKLARAIKYLETSIQDNVDFYDSVYLLGIIKSDTGEYEESNRYFEQANHLEQKLPAYYYMASNYRNLKDKKGEMATYERILNLNPTNYKALHALSQLYMEANEYLKASFYLEKLYTINPKARPILLEYLYALFAAREDQKFLKLVETVDISDSAMLLYAKALILSRQQKFDQALALLEAQQQKDFKSYLLIAEIYSQKQEFFLAYLTLEKIERLHWDSFYYSQKIQLFSALGLNQRLLDLFDALCQNKPVCQSLTVTDYYAILNACGNLNRLDKAREILLFIAATLKRDTVLVADLTRRLNDLSAPQALVIEGNLAKIGPNLFVLLSFYRAQQNDAAAIALLEQIIKSSNGSNQFAQLQLCNIYLKQQQFDKVESYLLALLTQFPDSPIIKNFLAYFWGEQNKNLEKALQLSAATLATDKDNLSFIDTYGCILLKLNRLTEAEPYLKKAYQKHPLDLDIIEHLVDYYRIKNEPEQILRIYQTAIDHGVDFKEQLLEKIKSIKTQPAK